MPSEQAPFDLHRLSQAIHEARTEQRLTWAEISSAVGVSPSTIRRFATATDAEADGVLALIGWLGVPPERFVMNSEIEGLPLPPVGNGMIRVDMALVDETSGASTRRPRTRTTIQRLTVTAHTNGVPIASLTRWSAV